MRPHMMSMNKNNDSSHLELWNPVGQALGHQSTSGRAICSHGWNMNLWKMIFHMNLMDYEQEANHYGKWIS